MLVYSHTADGSFSAQGDFAGKNGFILLGPNTFRSELIAVHEVSHLLTDFWAPDHGEEFTARYLDLTCKALGPFVGLELAKQFSLNNVLTG
jgi:hypothetical protein